MLSLNTNKNNIVTLKKDGKVIADIVFKDIKTGKKISVGVLNKKVLVKVSNTINKKTYRNYKIKR
ncbi:hypothetical protein LWE87_15825 [Clostridioides difficile]|uniref:hypothetical protein n=1 Tax=Clostridioides difficile TaxID=1496 RepID=UPI001E49AB58|nr:hypothetical protein [Clostridioides difficile]MCE0607813.1 hypothetical protein [Clostridioides difficile]MCE0618508.1 hypothetical protein [Clostridioides difficile]MCE0666273.1 hypothetical protein [Clostridioides difficile]